MAEDGELLGARIAADEQWRFPVTDSVPIKLRQAMLYQEDRYFEYHPGFNPVALIRALYLNLKHGEVRSGGSTLTMQVVRLSKNNPPRTLWEKLKEIVLATRLEWAYTKDGILALYLAHAPFGGNVVGHEAASWRYYGRSPHELSWAESATLAVLPNAPGLIHPGRNRTRLKEKRNALLLKLKEGDVMDDETYRLALLEDIPLQPKPLPDKAPHLTALLHQSQAGERISTTLESHWQQEATNLLNRHLASLSANHIKNGAVLLIENATGDVKAYVGNGSYGEATQGSYNNMIETPRSPGSILKPFLYASMLSGGGLLPDQLVEDVPTFLGGFKPENFDKTYEGAVPASEALARSLNIPAVLMLKEYSPARFLKRLHQLGFRQMGHSASHYGLSLILGGAEVTPWELGSAYYRMAAHVNSYHATGEQQAESIPQIHFLGEASVLEKVPLDRASAYQTFKVLTTVNRPDSEMGWQKFGGTKVAWKTGTSFGFRDAWAVGVTPKYTCVVWVGNADGEGRPGLIGAVAAGPVLFEMMNKLPQGDWFEEPSNEMLELEICTRSGLKASKNCPQTEARYVPQAGVAGDLCPYHFKIFLDDEGQQVARNCAGPGKMTETSWFVLPPAQAWFFAKKHSDYLPLPDWKPGCQPELMAALDVIYPKARGQVFIPREIGGEEGKVVLEVAHQKREERVFWHLNGRYLGHTETFHQMALYLKPGNYQLYVEDEEGNSARRKFEVLQKG